MKKEPTLEQLYSRFAGQGDVDALAEVFDRVAPDLERLAKRLTTDHNRAADLVQETFLTAMERPGTFDTDRALRPWLLGILVHKASEARRRVARETDSVSEGTSTERAPLAALGAVEFRAELTRAVRELPESMRRVVEGRLLDERNANELARELAISQGALRVRLHRGLERLRRALPTGLATGLALVFMHSKGLASARTVVLRRAVQASGGKAVATGTGASGVGSIALAKKAVSLVGLVGAALFVSWIYFDVVRGSEPDVLSPALVQLDSESPEPRTLAAKPELNTHREVVATVTPPTPTSGTVEVHVSFESGEPASGFTVDLALAASSGYDWTHSETDDEGVAMFTVSPGKRIRRLRVPGTLTTAPSSKWVNKTHEEGSSTQLELIVTAGYPIAGTVVDQEGRPVPSAEVRAWSGNALSLEEKPDRVASADANGEFLVEHVGENFVLEAATEKLACLQGLRGKLSKHTVAEGLQIVLAPARRVHGVVRTPEGDAVAGAKVWVPNGLNTRSPRDTTPIAGVLTFEAGQGTTKTDESGRFEIRHLPRERVGVQVKHAPFHLYSGSHETGEESQEIILDRGATLRGRVWTSTGQPAQGARVRFWPYYGNIHLGPHEFRCDERGEFLLTGMSLPNDYPDVSPALGVLYEGHAVKIVTGVVPAIEDAPSIDIQLEPEHVIAGKVVDIDSNPIAGVSVSIDGNRLLDLNTNYFDQKSTWEYHMDLSKATTDEQGRFRFEQLYEGEFSARVRFLTDIRKSIDVAVTTGTEDLVIVLDPKVAKKVVLKGAVRDGVTNLPLRSFSIIPMIDGAGAVRVFDAATSGAFEVSGLSSGPIELTARAEGYADHVVAERQYEVGEHQLDIVLFPQRSLELKVVDQEGQEVPNGKVAAFLPDGSSVHIQTPMGNNREVRLNKGRAQLHGLPATRVTLRVTTGPRSAERVTEYPVDLLTPLDHPLVVTVAGAPQVAHTAKLFLVFLVAESDEIESAIRAQERSPDQGQVPASLKEALRTGSLLPTHEIEVEVLSDDKVIASGTIAPDGDGRFSITKHGGANDWSQVGTAVSTTHESPQATLRFRELPSGLLRIKYRSGGYGSRTIDMNTSLSTGPRFVILRPMHKDE